MAAVRTALRRSLSPKDPSLEAALARDKPRTIHNLITRFLVCFQMKPWLRHQTPQARGSLLQKQARVSFLQRHFNRLPFPIRGSALSWLHKYPSCFHVLDSPCYKGGPSKLHFIFSQRMADCVFAVAYASQDAMVTRLVKLLMLSRDRRLGYEKISPIICTAFGFPVDFLACCPKDVIAAEPSPCIHNGFSYIRLLKWDPLLARSAVEASAGDGAPKFRFMLPDTRLKLRSRFDEFNDGIPYVSPYCEDWMAFDSLSPKLAEKRAVGVLHELLSLTLWKKLSILKLERFRREFGLPENLRQILMKHPGIFYVSSRYSTVVLREGYNGSELVEKDPVVAAMEQIGELVQEGLHEYNQQRKLLNLEEQRKRGELTVRQEEEDEDKEEAARATLPE